MLDTLRDFIHRVESLDDVSDAYYVFEEECTDQLRARIYSLTNPDSPERFRAAMFNMGFDKY